MKHHGEYWSREWKSDLDLSKELVDGPISTPLQNAIVDACTEVETDVLSSIVIHEVDGGFSIEAMLGLNTCTVRTHRCDKCNVVAYEDFSGRVHHPFNGCKSVVVEEIMSS